MKFFMTAVSAAAVASATAVFSVSDFTASCIPHSSQCSYSFGVLQPGTMETTPVTCSKMLTASGTSNLPDVTDGTCENSSRTWTITRSDAGLVFTVSQQVTPSSFQTGTYTIPADELAVATQPNAQVESYTGPTSFDLN
ncbi:hypothetical protein G7054_g4139 [Neopestalotiopsis clavispora]|nr:hypothetical protein E8E14_011080 [Neopestalotiopsis sp. 37M]KAF7536916.1 hypothetical protein G7054_g4139 [Neopestalotiopsis clavispora]